MLRKLLLAAASLAILLTSSSSYAASDGRLGNNSTGEIQILLIINQGIQISNLQDIEIIINTNAEGDTHISKRFCIRGNTEGSYSMTAFSDRGGSAPFSLSSSNDDQVEFELNFRGDLSNSVGDPLKPNIPSRQYKLNNDGVNCNGQDNAEIELVIPASQINQARDKQYNGYLNLTVAIE